MTSGRAAASQDGSRWTETDVQVWWSQNRQALAPVRQKTPVDHRGRTVAVDLRHRG